MLTYRQLDPNERTYFNEISFKMQMLLFKKLLLKGRQQNGSNYVSALMCNDKWPKWTLQRNELAKGILWRNMEN